MTELERIEIEGFKGIESLAFEPSQVNLITGRNNTGKTSLLEAASILLDPNKIHQFGGDVGSLINMKASESNLNAEINGCNSTVVLRPPTTEEVQRNLPAVLLELMKPPKYLIGSASQDAESEITERYRSVVKEAISEVTDEVNFDELGEEFLIVEVDGTSFPYFRGGKTSGEILSTATGIVEDKFTTNSDGDSHRLPTDLSYNEGEGLTTIWEDEHNYGVGFLATRRFFLSDPDTVGDAVFIDSAELTGDIEQKDEEKAAIKIDDIGDFIKEHGLVNDLKTFDLDYLVFEDEDDTKNQIPYYFMGDGFKAIVGLLWELLDDDIEDQIVLLEEPENHMHPGYTRQVVYFLIQLAREENVQLFITTHNNDFINDFFNENLTDEQREFLEEEFTLVRMEEQGAMVVDYETAEGDLKDLHLDLRGI